ncbi:hypothetical protein [Cohnella sp. 56]|uniref:hypothetical protein n=1 Tax=Cohnella sp. 56 TaxID=3113722 RepID=UPI0030E807E3
MSLADLPQVKRKLTADELSEVLSIVIQEIDFAFNGNIDARNIRAKSITAEKMTVEELSAISANLGHIIAGLIESVQIYGSYIATRKDSYPRVELNSSGDLIAVLLDANNSIKFVAGANISPNIEFHRNGNIAATLKMLNLGLELSLANGGFFHVTGGELFVDDVSNITDGISTLGMLLAGKASYSDLASVSASVSSMASNLTYDPTAKNLKLWAANGSLLAQVNIAGA